ncbi:MAG: alpha/beta fold hydrolase [Betaproteobacteria bacterium]
MSIHDAVIRRVPVSTYGSVSLNVRLGPVSGPPLLLLHGHPQTQLMWRKVWPELSSRFTLVAPDLRGYGDSDKPVGAPDHANYSKRVMAADCVELMRSLGHDTFLVAAHDRGARVAHRLAADHPQRVSALALLDIAPTLAMYEQTSEAFARAYWHWFFLIQPHPLPKTLLASKGPDYVRCMLGGRHAGLAPFEPEVLAEYQRCASDPATLHGFCEDYRASAGIDLEHDRADRDAGLTLQTPLLVLWGRHGVVHRCFDVLGEWRRVAADVRGEPLDCGHYLAEEQPEQVASRLLGFFEPVSGYGR